MTPQQHKARHKVLHAHLDELVADFITHTGMRMTDATVIELLTWSYHQTVKPTEHPNPEPMPETVEIAGDTVQLVYLAGNDPVYQPATGGFITVERDPSNPNRAIVRSQP